jgi:hypothetical protein
MVQTASLTPGVKVNIINNSQYTTLPTGLVYAGLFKTNRGPLSYYYYNQTQLANLCGLENPTVALGIGSLNDLLTQSNNVLGVRIIRLYNTSTAVGDAYAWTVYDNVLGWVTPTTTNVLSNNSPTGYMIDPTGYTFSTNQAFIIYSIAPGSYYNGINVTLRYNSTLSNYNVTVYDPIAQITENFQVTFNVTADGSDMSQFCETVVNGTSNYINFYCNYAYLENIQGVLSSSFFSTVTPASTAPFNSNNNNTDYSSSFQFLNFSVCNDNGGNSYVVGGYGHLSSSAYSNVNEPNCIFTPTIQKFNSTGLWNTLQNNNILFKNVPYQAGGTGNASSPGVGTGMYPLAAYSSYNGGTIYFFSTLASDQYLSKNSNYTISYSNFGLISGQSSGTLKITNTNVPTLGGGTSIYLTPDGTSFSPIPSTLFNMGTNQLASCVVASTANVASLNNSTAVIDGVTLANGNRVLLKNQTDSSENGIWIASTSGAWTVASDWAALLVSTPVGASAVITSGTTNGGTGWVCSTYSALSGDVTFTQGGLVLPAGCSVVLQAQAVNGTTIPTPLVQVWSDCQLFSYSFSTYSWTNQGIIQLPNYQSGSYQVWSLANAVPNAYTASDGTIIITAIMPDTTVVSMVFDPAAMEFLPAISLTALIPAVVGEFTTDTVSPKAVAPLIFGYSGATYLFNQANSGIYNIDFNYTTSSFGFSLSPVTGTSFTISYSAIPSATMSLVETIPSQYLTPNENIYTKLWVSGTNLYLLGFNSNGSGNTLASYNFATDTTVGYSAASVQYVNWLNYSYNNTQTSKALFAAPSLSNISTYGTNILMGSTVPSGTGITSSSVFLISNSLASSTQMVNGNDLPMNLLNDEDIIKSLTPLANKNTYPQLDLLIDSGFNDAAVSEAMNALVTARQDGFNIISMPAAYQYSETAATTYRTLSLNINNGNSFLATPGQYVRANNFNGNYSLFPISGAIGANCALNDNQSGPWQPPVGPNYGLLTTVTKLPPQNPNTPLTVNYTEINYVNTDLLLASQVNIVGRYNKLHPGIYLQTDLCLTSEISELQSLSINRMVIYIASQAALMAVRFLFMPNDFTTFQTCQVLYNTWLGQIASYPGALSSYSVICNNTNNTLASIDQGIMNITLNLTPTPLIKEIVINVIVNSLESSVSVSSQ